MIQATEEDRRKGLEKQREYRKQAEVLKQDWMDKPVWRELASQRGVRLAQKHIHCGEQTQKYITNRLKVDSQQVQEAFGLRSLKHFGKLNPKTPMYVFQGLVLEKLRDGDLDSTLI